MIRDLEIERLVKYAESMGCKVTLSSEHSENDAEWSIDGKEITLFKSDRMAKIDVVLSLIHEIGHMCEFVRNGNRQIDKKLEDALLTEEEKKRHRKKLLDWEIQGVKWWRDIYKDTDCRFPIYILYIFEDYDIWQYKVFYKTGSFPDKKTRRKKLKSLRVKYKNKMGNLNNG